MGVRDRIAKAAFRAWHGSPYDFDRFDLSKIGTGEAAQARGHGLYFAGDKPVAKHYRDVLGRDTGSEYFPDQPGHLYEVNINADQAHLLDWEKQIREQSPHVQDALRQLNFDYLEPWDSGKAAYKQLAEHPNTPQSDEFWKNPGNPAASAMLREAGVPGIRYLDNDTPVSRGLKPSYVMFDAGLVDIMKKLGVAAAAPAGMGALAAQDQYEAPQ